MTEPAPETPAVEQVTEPVGADQPETTVADAPGPSDNAAPAGPAPEEPSPGEPGEQVTVTLAVRFRNAPLTVSTARGVVVSVTVPADGQVTVPAAQAVFLRQLAA